MEWIAVSEAAKRLGISVGATYRLCNRGTLPRAVIAGKFVIRADAVEALKADTGYQARKRSRDGAPRAPKQRRLEL